MNGERGLCELRGDNKKRFLLMQLHAAKPNHFQAAKYIQNVSLFSISIPTLLHFSSSL